MKKKLFWTMALALTLSVGMWAKSPQGNSHGKGKGNPHSQAAQNHDRDDDRDDDRGNWERRGGWEYRTYDKDRTPPGWSKGKKTGWGNCDLPPGQAKKYGCNKYRYEGRDHYWYRDDGGRIVVRRPVISAHAGVDIH